MAGAKLSGIARTGHPAAWAAGKLVWLVPLVAVGVYLNTFHADFTYDDVDLVAKNVSLRSIGGIPALFTSTYWAGLDSAQDKSLYRPVTMTTYALEYRLHGLKPGAFHVTNVLLHALAALALLALVRQITRDDRIALVTGVLFAVHPIHTEAVSNIVGRAETLALLGLVASVWAYIRAMSARGQKAWIWGVASVLAYLGSMMSKEIGITAPAVIVLTETLFPPRRSLLRGTHRAIATFVGFGAAAALFLALRAEAVTNRVVHVGFAQASAGERVLTALRVLGEYVVLLAAPVHLTADYWLVPLARSPVEPRVLGALLLLAGLATAAAWSWRRHPAIAWGLGFAAVTIFPVSNLPFAIGVMKAERLLYSPSAGFLAAIAGALAIPLAGRRGRPAALVAVVLATAILSILTWQRNRDWHDNRALATATLRRVPNSPSFNVVMGNWYREHKDNAEARRYYARAVQALPTDKASLFNLGNIEMDEGNLEGAIAYYRRAVSLDPEYANAINNLGSAYQKMGDYDNAARMYARFRELRPDSPYPLLNLISAYLDAKNYQAALPLAEEALRRFPNNADIHYNAAALYGALGRTEDADRALARARALEGSAR